MESLAEALLKALGQFGMAKTVKENQLVAQWPEIVGEQIAKVSQAEKIEAGILNVKVINSVWRNELYYHKKELIKKLNKKAGEKLIKDIRFY